ncbi:MAG: non-homologous end-joining DNA ligase [Actinomycetota bacterium]|nr:non-homologous end-joining DNA ligase [Actinomycetota bacterium]
MSSATEVTVGGRRLKLSNLDKVLWPVTGFTKGQVIDYYAGVAPALLTHLRRRPVTLRRWPNGVDAKSFYEKNCPSHRPEWVPTITMGEVAYCSVEEEATLVWLANLAAIELHPTLARDGGHHPTALVFDLDPGAPADVLTCAQVALILRDILADLGLDSWVKTSGSKGLQLYAPLDGGASYDQTKPWSHALARHVESQHPKLVVTTQEKAVRRGKVLIDWSQNTESKTTVSVYSLRAGERPGVSTPLTWTEVGRALEADDGGLLRFTPDDVRQRLDDHGDLFAAVAEGGQALPGS